MKRENIITLFVLAILTLSTAVISNHSQVLKYAVMAILTLSAVKFLLVAFQFMELKKANNLWKILLLILLFSFVGTVTLIVN